MKNIGDIPNAMCCSAEQIYSDLDDDTKQKILPLKLISRKATEMINGGATMDTAGIRRLDDMESK